MAHRGATPREIEQGWDSQLTTLWQELEPLLGENGVARLKELRMELPAHTTVDLLNGRLGASRLSDEQNARLVQIVKSEPFKLTSGMVITDPVFFGTQEEIENHLREIRESNDRIVQQAGSFLGPEQLSGLNAVLSNAIGYRILSAASLMGKRPGAMDSGVQSHSGVSSRRNRL